MGIQKVLERGERRLRRPIRKIGKPEAAWKARRRISHRGKTLRAFRVYLDLIDTTRHMQVELRGQLDAFDLTPRGFRMLEMLYRHGPTIAAIMAKKLQCSRQNVHVLLRRLEKRGWVAQEIWALPPAPIPEYRLPKAKRKKRREGPRFGLIRLTRQGRNFIGSVFPKHAKVVKSLMRVLDGREQLTLSRVLLKLREGDVATFVREIRMEDEEDWGKVMKARG